MFQFILRHYNKIFVLLSLVLTVLVALRAYLVPFAHDEVASFYYYIQSGKFIPFYAHVDANGHFLTNLSSWICYKFFGSSPFALRIPNIFAFVLLCYACFKLSHLLNGIYAKSFLFFGFVVAFHFTAFFSLCRGYGLSMAFLLWALSHFFLAFKNKELKHMLLFVVGAQLALAANLTLVFVVLFCSGILIIQQWLHNKKTNIKSIGMWTIHFLLLAFWIKYAFFLQHQGALYYGSGNNYWQVTFVSLIETIFFKNVWLNVLVALLFICLTLYCCFGIYQHRSRFILQSNFALTFLMLAGLMVAFYILKKLFHVNYPEDRTGLFFYVFFVLALAFKVSEARHRYQKLALAFPLFVSLHFLSNVNLTVHPWRIYETFPPRFIKKLISEQKKSNNKITVAGHRLRELIYGFMNYNMGGQLNHITSPEALQMNADYAIAYTDDAAYYRPYYEVLDTEPAWNFVLLKRKKAITRQILYESKALQSFNGNAEFNNAYEVKDTVLGNGRPLLAEFNLKIHQVPVPFNAWLVMQIDEVGKDPSNHLIRVPLNLIRKNLHQNGLLTLHLLSGNLPTHVKRLVCYLWNIDQKPIEVQLVNFKLYQLQGEGLEVISQAKI